MMSHKPRISYISKTILVVINIGLKSRGAMSSQEGTHRLECMQRELFREELITISKCHKFQLPIKKTVGS